MIRHLVFRLTPAIVIFLSSSGPTLGQYRVCATGQLDNSFNYKASKQACESGDFDCVHTEYTIEQYNMLTATQLRANCDIVIYGFSSNDLLKCNPNTSAFEDCGPGETLYTLHIEPFLNMGGGVIFENPSEWVDLIPGVDAERIWPTNTDWCSLVITDSVPGLTEGILDRMDCFNNLNWSCFSNFHQKFVNWNPFLFPFIASEGIRSLNGGAFEPDPDCDSGAIAGLYGEYPGGGRILLMGVDNDYHGARWDLGPAGDGSFRRNYNQYKFMLNELAWVAPVTCPDNDLDGYTVCDGDCNDSNASVHPGAPETCNGIDDNCNGLIDEGFDNDGDGFTVCNGDCNDFDASIFPGSVEVCGDSIDNDCDGQVDEGCASCIPSVPKERGPRCSDGIDNDCDGLIDEMDPDCGSTACVPTTPKERGSKCSDGIDNDCDGLIDEADPDC